MVEIMRLTALEVFKAIVNSNGNSIEKIRKTSGVTYSYVCKLIKFFENQGFISTKIVGRERDVTFTKKGMEIYKLLLLIEKEGVK